MAKENGAAPLLTFNFDAMTAKDLGNFMKGVKGPEDVTQMSEALTRIVVDCPKEWGAKDNPETYANQSWRKVWKAVIFPSILDGLKNEEGE